MDYIEMLTEFGAMELKRRGKKLRQKDSNDSGNDDVGGRSLEAIGEAISAIDFGGINNPKSLTNIGIALEAAGKKLQLEAGKLQ